MVLRPWLATTAGSALACAKGASQPTSSALIRPIDLARSATIFGHPNSESTTDGTKYGAVSRHVADSVIARVVKALDGRLPGISFQVVETPEGLPEPIRAYAAAQKVRKPRGVYSEGVVWMVLSSHMSAKEVKKTVFHELHGHAGLDKLYGNTIIQALDDILGA